MAPTPPDLRTEVSRLARLRHLQGALPPVLRGAPVAALAVGALAARLAGAARNPVEDRLLGPAVGTIELAPPPPPPPPSSKKKPEEEPRGEPPIQDVPTTTGSEAAAAAAAEGERRRR